MRYLPLLFMAAILLAIIYSLFLASPQTVELHGPGPEEPGCMEGTSRRCQVGNCTGLSICSGGGFGPCKLERVCSPGEQVPCIKEGCAKGYRRCNGCGTGYGDCVFFG
jgi:hypothetical protein